MSVMSRPRLWHQVSRKLAVDASAGLRTTEPPRCDIIGDPRHPKAQFAAIAHFLLMEVGSRCA